MGRKYRKTDKSLRPLEKANDSVALSKQKKLGKMMKEKEFIEHFDERQTVKPAISLKLGPGSNAGHPNITSTTMDRKAKKRNKRRNDGNSAVHQTVKQMVAMESSTIEKENSESHRHKEKRKFTFSSESSGDEKEYAVNCKSNQKTVKENSKSTKRVKLAIESDSDATSNSEDFIDQDKQFFEDEALEEDEEESFDDDLEDGELGDDLEDEELERADAEELGLEDEDETNSSFFTSDDGSLEDEIGDNSEEEPFVLDFTGYQSTAKSTKCLFLEALDDFTIATSPFVLFKFSDGVEHSVQVAVKALQWIIGPIDSQTFFKDLFQKRVLMVTRKSKDYFDGFFETAELFEMLQKFDMDFGSDVNVCLYENGTTTTHNGTDGERATAAVIWEHIGRGRAAQFVRPQRLNDKIWYLCEILQELFCAFVGANCYLTPPNISAIAPHWEDIDAFLLQIEGRQYFKVYCPANDEDTLPLESNGTMTESDFDGREPTFEGWVEQGDTLYIPRGWIYHARVGDVFSLHLTVSACRHFSFANLLEKASAEFAKTLVAGSKYLRQTLPPLLLDMAGISGSDYPGEKTLEEKIVPIAEIFSRKFGENFASYVPSYIDLMGREFFNFALPPLLSPEEKKKISFGGKIGTSFDIGNETEIRLVRKHTQRLLFENSEKAFIVHRMANSRGCEDYPENPIDFPVQFEDGFVTLVDYYPNWVKVHELGLESQEANVELAKLLFKNGILLAQRTNTFEEEEEKEKEEVGKDLKKAEANNNKTGKKNKKRRKKKKGAGDAVEEREEAN